MSQDFDRFLNYPGEMIWEPGTQFSSTIRYRLIDAPLTRYIIGIGRRISSLPAQSADWDWAASWSENRQNGALPNNSSLIAARLSVASLFPLGLILLYRLGIMLSNKIGGLAAVLIFGTNALVLLHTRRAMTESVLVFSVIACLFVILRADKRPLLAGFMVALAFNAKHSAIALLPIGMLAVCWIPTEKLKVLQISRSKLIQYLACFALMTFLLNPFLWRHPVQAAQEALKQRKALLQNQVGDVRNQASSQELETPSERVAVLLAQLYLIPPSFSEVGNYRSQTLSAETSYLEIFGNQLGRGAVTGGTILFISLLGILASFRDVNGAGYKSRKRMLLFLLAFITMAFGQIGLVPLPWQRYSMSLIPFVSLFFGIGFAWGIKNSRRILSHGRLVNRLSEILSQLAPDSWMS